MGLALVPMLCLHAFMRIITDSLGAMKLQGASADARMPVLIYGARHLGKLFLRDQKAHCLKSGAIVRVMGFMDHDTNLHGRLVHGLHVFGAMEHLESAIKKTSCKLIVVTTELSAEARAELRAIASKACIAVWEWQPVLRDMLQQNSDIDLQIGDMLKLQANFAFQQQLAEQSRQSGLGSGVESEEGSLAFEYPQGSSAVPEYFRNSR